MHNEKTFPGSRREFICMLSTSCASLLSPNLLAGDLASIKRISGGPLRQGALLSLAQMQTLAALADIIIPRGDSTSASDVDTHGVIDDQLANCKKPSAAREFIANLDNFSSTAIAYSGNKLENLPQDTQHQLVKSLASHTAPFNNLDASWFSSLKSMVVLGYYTSAEGGSKELVYDPIPGGYNGHFKLSENNGRAFSIFHI